MLVPDFSGLTAQSKSVYISLDLFGSLLIAFFLKGDSLSLLKTGTLLK